METSICLVCGIFHQDGKKDPKVHIHYGALSCMGCKAFFRRCVREKSTHTCKGTGNCEVGGKQRIKCKKCRYEKCLTIGMDPSLVLTDEADRLKFSRMSCRPSKQPSVERPTPILESNPVKVNDIGEKEEETDAIVCERIREKYVLAWSEVDIGQNVVTDITNLQQDPVSNSLKDESACFNDLLIAYQSQFRVFSRHIESFQSLKKEDQKILITRNESLVAHYCLARYLTATNGWDQLTWILGPYTPVLGTLLRLLLQQNSLSKQPLKCSRH